MREEELLHRDDFDMDDIKKLEDGIGNKVHFAGDLSPDAFGGAIGAAIRIIEERMSHSISEGVCLDCGKRIPVDWPPKDDTFKLPKGWATFHKAKGDTRVPQAIQCDQCNEKEGGATDRVFMGVIPPSEDEEYEFDGD